jgi:hypothetical protein
LVILVPRQAARLRARLMLVGELGAQQLDRLLDRRAVLATRVEGTQHVIGQAGERPTVKWLSAICAVERYQMTKFFRKSPKSFNQG